MYFICERPRIIVSLRDDTLYRVVYISRFASFLQRFRDKFFLARTSKSNLSGTTSVAGRIANCFAKYRIYTSGSSSSRWRNRGLFFVARRVIYRWLARYPSKISRALLLREIKRRCAERRNAAIYSARFSSQPVFPASPPPASHFPPFLPFQTGYRTSFLALERSRKMGAPFERIN